jgi:hypothetical protein
MNKLALLLAQLHEAETGLAAEYRAVADRHAAEHDIYYLGHTLATQCDEHAETVRTIGQSRPAQFTECGMPVGTAMTAPGPARTIWPPISDETSRPGSSTSR